MSLIVETGTASSASEAYASVAFCDTYHANNGNTLWATLQTAEKEQAIRRATLFMCQTYRMQWKGSRVNMNQALDWPRYAVQVPDLGVYNVIYPTVIPVIVQQANAELALTAAYGNLNPDNAQNIISKEVGPLKIVYDANSPQSKRYQAVGNLLQPLLSYVSGGGVKLKRA